MTDAPPDPDRSSQIMAALTALNERYGRGQVIGVDYENRTFTRRELPRGNVVSKPFTLSPCNSMVSACGHWQTF